MCSGVQIEIEGKPLKVYFPNPKAALPVVRSSGGRLMFPWGARSIEYAIDKITGEKTKWKWPQGGWARHESIKAGTWDKFSPRPVKIPALAYMEKDSDEASHWFDLEPGQFIQGLVAQLIGERRIYVVTVSTPPEYRHIHDRWPRIVGLHNA